ncbi:MAG: PUR family DNA/RNA-binding protein [Saprospiraceae bacterium]|nr:PUR family DNA/RNA-binding protein [Saprospiraceae bacterium]
MDNGRNSKFVSVYSKKVRAGKRRTYFFDVRRTKGDDFYLTLTESTKKFNGEGYERHKIFLYKEDFNRFLLGLEDVINHVKNDLMPDYDYDEFTRRHDEYEYDEEEDDLEEDQQKPEPRNILNEDDDMTW